MESRLERLKSEAIVILQHNERLESNKEDGANKLAAEALNDSEVSAICPFNKRAMTCQKVACLVCILGTMSIYKIKVDSTQSSIEYLVCKVVLSTKADSF